MKRRVPAGHGGGTILESNPEFRERKLQDPQGVRRSLIKVWLWPFKRRDGGYTDRQTDQSLLQREGALYLFFFHLPHWKLCRFGTVQKDQ